MHIKELYTIRLITFHEHLLMFLSLQASSDLSILDFDIPFSIIFVVASGLELLSIIGVTASITWPVLIVAIFAIVAVYYVQVDNGVLLYIL